MENLNEETKREINTKSSILKPKEVFTFVTHDNRKLEAVCINCIGRKYIDHLDVMYYVFLCYSQNSLFYICQMRDMANGECIIKDLNKSIVDVCVIPEYDRIIDDVIV